MIPLTPSWGYSVLRSSWRTDMRNELGDSGGTPLWATADLNRWLNEAIRDYSRAVPAESSTTIATVTSQATYAIPSGLKDIIRVEHPVNVYRTYQPRTAGEYRLTTSYPTPVAERVAGGYAYEVYAGQLVLEPAPTASSETITLWYTATRAEPTADTDPLPVPGEDVELLTWFVAGRALGWIGTQEGKRQAYERQRGAEAGGMRNYYGAMYEAGLLKRTRTRTTAPRRLEIVDR